MNDKLFKTIQLLLLATIAIVLITKMDNNRYQYIDDYEHDYTTEIKSRVAIFDKKTGEIYIGNYSKKPTTESRLLDLLGVQLKNETVENVLKLDLKKQYHESLKEQ